MGYAVVDKICGTDLIAGSAIRVPVLGDVQQIRSTMLTELCAASGLLGP